MKITFLLLAIPLCAQRAPLAEEVFKNVQVLRGIPVDEFMNTMGIFSAALGMSCENCHAANDAKWENYATDNPRKQTTRRMVTMVKGINQTYFNGRQTVTCYACHRGGDHPKVTPNLDLINGVMLEEEPDDLVAPDRNAPPADTILDKYIQAVGGAQRLAGLTSFIARGTSSGYGPEGEKRPAELYVKAPAQRTTVIHTLSGDNISVFDGQQAWVAAPLAPVTVLARTGGELAGAKLEAELSFPGRVKTLAQWRVGRPTTVNDRKVQVLQGTLAGNAGLATLYFDDESSLLVRFLRYANSPVGRIPAQTDYSDYREVNGIKLPFQWTLTWLDGREKFEWTEYRVNVPVDAARFAKPVK